MSLSLGLRAVAALVVLVVPTTALNYNVSLNSQTHLAYAGPNGMVVSWNTYNVIAKPTVRYGLSPDKLDSTASSNISVTYNTSLTYNNHVAITGLQSDTIYYYMPTSLMASDQSATPFSFRTSRPAGDLTPYSIAVVVDMGTFGPEGLGTSAPKSVVMNNVLSPGEPTTIDSIVKVLSDVDFLMHPGDIAYADAWIKEASAGYINASINLAEGYKAYESILDDFYDQMTPITAFKPYMVGPGNHEANCDNGGTGSFGLEVCMPGQTNFTGYRNHYRMPSAESGGLESFWYSHDSGMVHYVQIDTETDLGHGLVGPDEPLGGTENSGPFGLMNQQIEWLTNDLASVDRIKTPWVVVAGHRPWYSSGSICKNCSAAFEPLFVKYGVDLYLSGHFHVYERLSPIANNISDPNGLNNPSSPWYIVNGAGGHYDGLDNFTLPYMPYHRFGLSSLNATYGWSKLTFHNCTHLTHSFVASKNNTLIDTQTLFKNRTCKANPPASITTVVYTTQVSTVTSCAASVTSCSPRVVTSTIPLYTALFPTAMSATNPPNATLTVSVSKTSNPAQVTGVATLIYASRVVLFFAAIAALIVL